MPRSEKTWGSSRAALQSRVQQSRSARNPSLLNTVQSGRIQSSLTRPRSTVDFRGRDVQLRFLTKAALQSPFDTPESYMNRAGRRAGAVRVYPSHTHTATPNPVNIDELAARLVLALERLAVENELLSSPFAEALRDRKFVDQMRRWCYHLVKLMSKDPKMIHPVVPLYNGDVLVGCQPRTKSISEAITEADPSGFECAKHSGYLMIHAEVPKWLRNDPSAFTDPNSRPVWINPSSFISTRNTLIVMCASRFLRRLNPFLARSSLDPIRDGFIPVSEYVSDLARGDSTGTQNAKEVTFNQGHLIAKAFIGFLLLREEIDRNWSDYDLHKWAEESNIRVRRARHLEIMGRSLAEIIEHDVPMHYLGEFYGSPYVMIPLTTSYLLNLEGELMMNCLGSYTIGGSRIHYSIRQAVKEGDTYVPIRSRIVFDIVKTLQIDYDRMNGTTDNPSEIPITTKSMVGSVAGFHNHNNVKWKPLVEAAARLLNIPELIDGYVPHNLDNFEGEDN